MPEFFEHLNPMPFEAAAQMEKDLAEDLRALEIHGHWRDVGFQRMKPRAKKSAGPLTDWPTTRLFPPEQFHLHPYSRRMQQEFVNFFTNPRHAGCGDVATASVRRGIEPQDSFLDRFTVVRLPAGSAASSTVSEQSSITPSER